MKRTVVARMDLGMTRIAGFLIYDSVTKEFEELTPKVVEKLVAARAVNGLIIDTDGEIVPDRDGWNLGNIKIKSGVGNYRDFNTLEPKGDTVYSVVRAMKLDDKVTIYEVINNRCARVFYNEKQLRALAQFSWVGGVRITDDAVSLCNGVIEDTVDTKNFYEVGNTVYKVTAANETKPKNELDELFENNTADDSADDMNGFKVMPEQTEPIAPACTENADPSEEAGEIEDNVEEKLKELFGFPETENPDEVKESETGNSDTTGEDNNMAELKESEAVESTEEVEEAGTLVETDGAVETGNKKSKSHNKKHH